MEQQQTTSAAAGAPSVSALPGAAVPPTLSALSATADTAAAVVTGGEAVMDRAREEKTLPLDHVLHNSEDGGFVEEAMETPLVGGKAGGLSVLMTSLFLVGEMAGSGVLALPAAIAKSGWIGILVMLCCCLVSGYNGINLGRCWSLLLERYPDYRDGHHRYPYPAIAQQAFGRPMRWAVSAAVDLTLFGVSTVFLLLAAQNVQALLHDLAGLHFSFCFVLLLLAAPLIPASWLASPKDFWPAAVLASAATGLACLLLDVKLGLELPDSPPLEEPPTFHSFSLAFGAILFAFGGAATFPTIQHDMKQPAKFSRAVVVAYTGLLLLYVPVSVLGYSVFGADVSNNVLNSVPAGPLRSAVQGLITVHLVFAIIIALNPLSQHVEEGLRVPNAFCWQRCVVRTGLMLSILFVAEALPHFGALLDLVGGSTTTFLTFIAPSLLYLRLARQRGPWTPVHIPLYEWVLNVEVVGVGVLGGLAATYSAILEIVSPGTFVMPCFLNMTAAEGGR